MYKTLDYQEIWLIQRYAQFWFFRKESGTRFPTAFYVWLFNKKCFSSYILLTDQISLSDCIYLLSFGQYGIAIVCWPGRDVINLEINLIFLIMPFFYMTKRSRQKFKYLRTKIAFKMKWKTFFIIFKGLSGPSKIVSDLRVHL